MFPTVIVLLFLSAYPFIYNIYLSMTDLRLGSENTIFIGWANYRRFFVTDGFDSLKITLLFVFGAVFLEFVIGFALALLLSQDLKGKTLFRSIIIYPMVISPAAVGLMGMLMWDKDMGIINYIISLLHLQRKAFLADPSTALLTVIATDVWQWTGFMMLIFVAGLASLPTQPYEAAEIDGASGIQIFRYITLPFMSGSILVALLFRTMDAFKVFDLVYFMTGGGPGTITQVLNFYGYKRAFRYFELGYSTAIAVIMIILIIGISQVYVGLFRKIWRNKL